MRNAMSLSQLIYVCDVCVCVCLGGCASVRVCVLFTCKPLKFKSFLLCHAASVWLGIRPGLVCSCPGNWQLAHGYFTYTPRIQPASATPTPPSYFPASMDIYIH